MTKERPQVFTETIKVIDPMTDSPEEALEKLSACFSGTYTGVMQFTFAAACASIIFAPVGLPLAIGIQHGLVGFVVTQAVVARTTSVRGGVALAVPSFEVLPFLARFAVIAAGAVGADEGGLGHGATVGRGRPGVSPLGGDGRAAGLLRTLAACNPSPSIATAGPRSSKP